VRTGKRSATAALKARSARANAKRSITELQAALKDSCREEATAKGAPLWQRSRGHSLARELIILPPWILSRIYRSVEAGMGFPSALRGGPKRVHGQPEAKLG
jgi:hypothetical protein